MNRLRILLITTALITGSSALASAQEHYQAGFSVQVRLGGHNGDDHAYFSFADRQGDHDRNNWYVDRDHGKDRDDRDNRWRGKGDNDDRRGRDFDHGGRDFGHDGDRR